MRTFRLTIHVHNMDHIQQATKHIHKASSWHLSKPLSIPKLTIVQKCNVQNYKFGLLDGFEIETWLSNACPS
jgi:hypothetical protein